MKTSISKTKATAIALFLVLTIAVSCVALPIATAHTPAWEVETFAYIAVGPNPVGVNQPVGVNLWLNVYPPTAVGAYGDRWDGFTVDITKPDGSKETLGPFTSDPVGGYWTQYTPTDVGTYTFVFKFAGDKITGAPVPPGGYFFGTDVYINDTYKASQSAPVTLTVQEQPIETYQETPLPEGYWTRPINAVNHGWWEVAGNYLGRASLTGSHPKYTTGPESAHIMWTREYWSGGIMGDQFGDLPYYDGLSYEGYWGGLGAAGGLIINGKLYYNVQTPPRYGWYCIDLRTGEEYWFHNATRPGTVGGTFSDSGTWPGIDFGQIYDYESPNQHGGFPYLWSAWGNVTGSIFIPGYGLIELSDNVWDMYDAFTGNYICSINHVPSSSVEMFGADMSATGKDGSLLIYPIVDLTPYGPTRSYYLQCWNSSRAIWYKPSYSSNEYWMWRPYVGTVFDGNNGYSLNVSLAGKYLPGTPQWVVGEEILVGKSGFAGFGATGTNDTTTMWAISLKRGQEGNLLWSQTRSTNHMGHQNLTYSPSAFSIDDGYFSIRCTETMQEWVYSLTTGELMWGPTPASDTQYDLYSTGFGATMIAYGKLLTCGMGGVLRAWDIKTGKALWNYSATSIGFDSPYGANYPLSFAFVADGKAYLYSSEHSPSKPAWRGAMLRCVNLTDGAEIWTITHWGNGPSIADGYIVDLNAYDNRIYCYGKGPSATTVTATPKVSVNGDGVLIEGTVTDQCAGAKALAEDFGYVAGVPAIADADQKAWMEYLYMQRSCPTSATGVEVTLDTLDPNGNFVHIGTVISDISGMFKKMFVPEVPGEYTIIATFAGSASYGSSYAQTSIGVEDAPAASPPIEFPQPIDYTMHFILVAIAIIIAIAIAVVLLLLKRK